MKVLETERLLLRSFRPEDKAEIHRLVYADPQVAPFWSSRTWALDEITESFARKLAQHPNGLDFQAIILNATGAMIGLIGFQLYEEGDMEQWMTFENAASHLPYDPDFFEVELTYALGYAFWHNGYATEAGKALIEHGFRELNIGRIVNSVAAENIRSVNLMKRLGLHLQRNLMPTPFTGPWRNSPGVIGILANPHWQRRKDNCSMTNITGRLYAGQHDLAALLGLIRARPAARVLDFPSLYDLHELLGMASRRAHTHLWFDRADQLLGFAILDLSFNNMWVEVATNVPEDLVLAQMIDWGIVRLRQPHAVIHNAGVLQMSCRADHRQRMAQLQAQGFVQQEWYAVQMTRSLDEPIPPPQPPPGFTIRHVPGEAEAAAVAALHRAAFGTAAMTTENRLAMMRVPEYDQTLDWVAVAPDGPLAAYVLGSISSEENALAGIQRGYTDPVATHPDYQRRGLARALLLTGLHILKARGMTEVVLGTNSENQAMQATAQAVGYRITGKTLFFHKLL